MTKNRTRDLFSLLMLLVIVCVASTLAPGQTFSVLYNFGTNSGDLTDPLGFIAQGHDGNLHSTADGGGAYGYGAIFRITPAGTLTRLYSFDSALGPGESGLVLATDGNFYGTTEGSGGGSSGALFKVTPSGTLTVLYTFQGPDGSDPVAPPIRATDENFYGTTALGGAHSLGTVYKLTSSSTLTTLHSFDGTHGEIPYAPLVQGLDGNFYGTTSSGGSKCQLCGVVYKITPGGKFTVIYNFDGTHGAGPTLGSLIQGSDGSFYGTTTEGGPKGYGNVFKITPTGKLTVLYNMNGTTDGWQPNAGLLLATDGNFYGSTAYGGSSNNNNCNPSTGPGCGIIFQITPNGAYKVLHNFDSTAGQLPYATLLQHTNGILYGDTYQGGTGTQCGTFGCGVFYSLNMGLKSFVSLVSTTGKVGKTVEILGQGFKGTTAVSFNGVPAAFKVVSNTYMTAVVPIGATTGFITVMTPKTKLKSNKKFRVIT